MTLNKHDELITAVRLCNVRHATQLHNGGASLAQDLMDELLAEMVERRILNVAGWLEERGARLSQNAKDELLEEMVERRILNVAVWLEERGARLSQNVKDELLTKVVKRPALYMVVWLRQRGARLSQGARDELLVEMVERPHLVSGWLEEWGATVSQDVKDEFLLEAVKRHSLGVATNVEEHGARLSQDMKDELLEEMVELGFLNVAGWLEERGARLSQNVKDDLFAKMVERRTLNVVGWLEEHGSRPSQDLKDELLAKNVKAGYFNDARLLDKWGAKIRAPDEVLEHLCISLEPKENVITWIQMFHRRNNAQLSETALQLIFGLRPLTNWAARLLRANAKIRPNTVLFSLYLKNYGPEDPRVILQSEKCDLDELASLFSNANRNLPRVVFQRLSRRRIFVKSMEGTLHSAPEDLLRLRSEAVCGLLRLREAWGQTTLPLDLSDVEDDLLKFLVHYLERPPSAVDWDLLRQPEQSRFNEIADEYFIT